MEPYDLILEDLKEKTDKTQQHLRDQLGTIRTGRASPALVDTIRVEYYGAPTPLNQVAHISVPEARQLMIKPFDASPDVIREIEKAILKSDLGLNPQGDGKALRLVMPPLISWPFAALFALLLWSTGWTGWGTMLAGLFIGYVAYDWIHYYTHHGKPKGPIGKFMRRYHMEHHFKDQTTHHGLSSPLWDLLLGTFTKPTEATAIEVELTGRDD